MGIKKGLSSHAGDERLPSAVPPTLRAQRARALAALTGGTRRGLAGAPGRTKRLQSAGCFQPTASLLCSGGTALFSRSSHFSMVTNTLYTTAFPRWQEEKGRKTGPPRGRAGQNAGSELFRRFLHRCQIWKRSKLRQQSRQSFRSPCSRIHLAPTSSPQPSQI